MAAVSSPVKESYAAPPVSGDTVFLSSASLPATAPRRELSTFRYSYSSIFSTALRFPFKPVCLPVPVTPQGGSYSPIVLYPTHAAFATTAFLTARIIDLYIRDFVSVSTYSPYAVMTPRPITHGHLWLAFALPF